MARRVYLHIGRSKTGTSSTQRTLRDNSARLTAMGFCYPGVNRNHNYIARRLATGDMTVPQRVLDEIDAATGDVIVSAEGFQDLAPEKARAWLQGFDVHVIVYLREQAAALASSYQQWIKARLETRSFDTFAAERGGIDYVSFLDSWAASFGRAAMTVRLYEREELCGGDSVLDFLSLIGIDPAALRIETSDANPSIAGALLEAKRRLNAVYRGSEEELRSKTYAALLDLARANPAYRGAFAPSAETVAHIRESCRASNCRLAAKYLNRPTAFREAPPPAFTPPSETEIAVAYAALTALL